MISLNNVSFGYTDKNLFSDVNVQINIKDKIGLVGRNGSGKTTLLKILSNEIKDYNGKIEFVSGISIGFLPQEVYFLKDDITPFDLCKQAFLNIEKKIKRLEELSNKLDDANSHIEYDKILNELKENNSFSYEYKIRMVLSSLGLSLKDINTKFSQLSGGYKVRSYLGYLMLLEPDILMLDEPTNYLDIDAIKYLIDYLKNYQKSFILISHDKNMLDSVTNKIWDLFAGKIYEYSNCNYTSFIERKEEYIEQLEKKLKNNEIKIKEQLEFINRFRAKESKASSVQSRIKMLEKIEKIEIPHESKINFKINSSNNSFTNILSCENLYFGFGEENLLENVFFSILRGERVFLIGRNGIGKTTFLKLLVSQILPRKGKVVVHNNSKIGYFEQNSTLNENLNYSVYEYFLTSSYAQKLTETERKKILGNFGFIKDDVEKKLHFLSGGEKVRLILAKIFLANPDILILDEPTTHLDIGTKDILIENLENYNGAILAVSHDIDFIQKLANKYITLVNKNLVWLNDISEYFEISDQNISKNSQENNKDNNKNQNKLSTNKRQQIEKQILTIEQDIIELEKKIHNIEKKFSENLTFSEIQKITIDYNELKIEYEKKFEKLLELEDLIK